MAKFQVKLVMFLFTVCTFFTNVNAQNVQTEVNKLIASKNYNSVAIPKKNVSTLSLEKATTKNSKQLTVSCKDGTSMLFVTDLKGQIIYFGQTSNYTRGVPEFIKCSKPYLDEYACGERSAGSAALEVLNCAIEHLDPIPHR